MPASRRVRGFIRSNVVGFVALFVALGGVAWSASTAPKNSVTSKSIKNGQVKASDLADKAVTSSKLAPNSVGGANVQDGSLGTSDIAPNALTGSLIQDGSLQTADLAANAVTGAKLDSSSVLSTLKVDRAIATLNSGGATVPFYESSPWTLTGHCPDDGGGFAHAFITISAAAPAAILDVNKGAGGWTNERFTSGPATTPVAQTASTSTVASAGGTFIAQLPGFSNNFSGTVSALADPLDFSAGTVCEFVFNGSGN